MFSLPLNPKLSNIQLNHLQQFLREYREYIYDLYFTCRMPPFTQDAMGDVFPEQGDVVALIEVALMLQRNTGVPVSATFNNIEVAPTQDNLDLFIMNFRQLYDAGVRSITIPHTHWVATGELQKAFPDLLIKNTILRQVETAKDVANLGKEGFNYVNIHRDLMRDQETLKRIRKAADMYGMKVALLANEGCWGGCSMMKEHFQFNNNRTDGPQYFNDPISRVSCTKWDVLESSSQLKAANIPPWREDWVELLQYVDVFKMHGRESISRFYESINIIKKYANNEEILFDNFNSYLEDNNLGDKPIDAWRKIIKTCKFDCWDCNFCEKVYNRKSAIEAPEIVKDVVKSLDTHTTLDYTNNVSGLTSTRVKRLLHSIGQTRKRYLEVGSAMGATAVSVLDTGIDVTCVDNWSTDIQPEGGAFDLPENDRFEFDQNTQRYSNLTTHDCDMFEAKPEGKFDFFFYDGDHSEETTAKAVEYYSQFFDREAVLIFDDANWTEVITGALKGISKTDYDILFESKMLNNIEDSTKWWNGLYIMVVRKNDAIKIQSVLV